MCIGCVQCGPQRYIRPMRAPCDVSRLLYGADVPSSESAALSCSKLWLMVIRHLAIFFHGMP